MRITQSRIVESIRNVVQCSICLFRSKSLTSLIILPIFPVRCCMHQRLTSAYPAGLREETSNGAQGENSNDLERKDELFRAAVYSSYSISAGEDDVTDVACCSLVACLCLELKISTSQLRHLITAPPCRTVFRHNINRMFFGY